MLLNYASRFIICPLAVYIGQALGAVRFATGGQIITVGIILAIFSVVADSVILPRVGNPMATAMDWVAATVVLWFFGLVAAGALVTWAGAAITAAILAATEFAMHSWLNAVRGWREHKRRT